jgi:C4-type Zn-finger protein
MKTKIICPNCKKTLEIMWANHLPNDLSTIPYYDVVGHCRSCGYDAEWDYFFDPEKMTEPVELNVKRYFFG